MPGRNIVLIGMMGSGKTAVGRHLAKRLDLAFVDTDDVFTQDMPITEIFEREGEAGLRQRERAAITEISQRLDSVIATGGGAVLDPDNVRALQASGDVVYLEGSVATLAARIGDPSSRPLLAGQPADRLASILAERRALYEDAAQYVVSTDDKDIETVVNEIVELLR